MDYKGFHKFNRKFYWIGIVYIFLALLAMFFIDWQSPPFEEFQLLMMVLFFGGIYFFIGVGFILPGIGGLKYGVLTFRWFLASPLTLAMPEKITGNSAKTGSITVILIGIGILVLGTFVLFSAMSRELTEGNLANNELLCLEEAQTKLNELRDAIDSAVLQKTSQTANFVLNHCKAESESIRFSKEINLMEYRYRGKQVEGTFIEYDNFTVRALLTTSEEITIPYLPNSGCETKDGYILTGFKNSTPQGEYLITNPTQPTDPETTICIYKNQIYSKTTS